MRVATHVFGISDQCSFQATFSVIYDFNFQCHIHIRTNNSVTKFIALDTEECRFMQFMGKCVKNIALFIVPPSVFATVTYPTFTREFQIFYPNIYRAGRLVIR